MFSGSKIILFSLSVALLSLADGSVVKRAVSQSQTQCVRIVTNHLTENEVGCTNAAQAITPLLGMGDGVVSELDSLSSSIFEQLCRPTCGRSIFTAWETCNITQSYGRQVQLIATLCGNRDNTHCYDDISGLFSFIESVENCQTDGENQCSAECRTLVEDRNRAFSCCVNVPLAYRSAGGETNLAAVIDSTLDKCGENRKSDCRVIIFETNFISTLTAENQSLSSEQILCVDSTIQGNNSLTSECKSAASDLTVHINSQSLIASLSDANTELEEFCKPSCGPTIISAWKTCNAFDSIQTDATYITAQCGLNQAKMPCYTLYDRILTGFDDSAYCAIRSNELACPSGCQTLYREFSQEIGCCSDPATNYLVANFRGGGGEVVRSATQITYDLCGFQVPSSCSESTFTAMPVQAMCPSSATIVVSSILSCSLMAIFYLVNFF